MARERTLYGLSYSPWTHRALFALDHHRIVYRYVEHVPLVGELRLRRLARSKKGTVPLLVSEGEVTLGSTAIARFADREGASETLFAPGLDAEIATWEARAEAIVAVARARVIHGIQESREAQRESLPAFVPAPLRPLFAFSAKQATAFLAKKHGVFGDPEPRVKAEVFPVMAELEAQVAAVGEGEGLLGAFGFADVLMATAVSALSPTSHEPGIPKLGPSTRAVWTCPAVVEAFPKVYAWRDRVYARRKSPA